MRPPGRVLLLGGTGDTAPIAESLLRAGWDVLVSTATDAPLTLPVGGVSAPGGDGRELAPSARRGADARTADAAHAPTPSGALVGPASAPGRGRLLRRHGPLDETSLARLLRQPLDLARAAVPLRADAPPRGMRCARPGCVDGAAAGEGDADAEAARSATATAATAALDACAAHDAREPDPAAPIRVVIDATHPYATAIRALAPRVCARVEVPYLSYLRPGSVAPAPPDGAMAVRASSAATGVQDPAWLYRATTHDEAAILAVRIALASARAPAMPWARGTLEPPTPSEPQGALDPLAETTSSPKCAPLPQADAGLTRRGGILLTIGAKHVAPYVAAARGAGLPVHVRVLNHPDSLRGCAAAGLVPEEITAARGPFSEAANRALIQAKGAAVVVSKDGGARGGMPEKLAAVEAEGCALVLVDRPPPPPGPHMHDIAALLRAITALPE